MAFHLKKNRCDLDLILTTPLKIKSVVPSYVPFQSKQLLSETFFFENALLKKYFDATCKMGHPVQYPKKVESLDLFRCF